MAVRNGLIGYTDPDPTIDPNANVLGGMGGAPLYSEPAPEAAPANAGGGMPDNSLVGAGGRATPFYIPPTAYPVDWSKLFAGLQGAPAAAPAAASASALLPAFNGLVGMPSDQTGQVLSGPSYQPIEGGEPGGGEPGTGLPGNGEPGGPPVVTGKLTSQSVFDYLRDVFTGKNREQGVVQNFGMFDFPGMGESFNPDFLLNMKPWLDSLGIKLQVKPSDNGKPSGRITLPDGRSVDLNVNGKWGWLDRGVLGPETTAATGGAGAGARSPGGGAAYTLDPRMSGAIDDALMNMLTNGMGSMGNATWDWLMRVLNTGGLYNDPMVKQQLVKARDAEAQGFNAQLADARAALADRGMVSVPGATQGNEVGAIEHISNDLGVTYAANVSQIEIEAMDRANKNMMSALQLATGLGEAQASNMLSAIGLGTQRQVALADLALRQLDLDQNWQMFLANYGLSIDQLQNDIRNGQWQQVMALMTLFLQNIQVGANGA